MKIIPDDKQEEFQGRQQEIYPKLALELINLIPQEWYSAVLELNKSKEGMGHSIYSDEGYTNVIVPSMELYEQTRKLELLFKEYGPVWENADFKVSWDDANEDWKYSVEYMY